MITKRQNALIMALMLFVFTAFPQKPANAIVPIAVGLTMQAIGAGGSVVVADMLTAGATSLIGGAIVALAITPTEMGNGENPVGLRVPTIDDPAKVALAMPPPDVPSTNPGTAIFYTGYKSGATVGEVCTLWAAGFGTQCTPSVNGTLTNVEVYANGTGGYCTFSWGCTSAGAAVSRSSDINCPVGYERSGSSCALTSARAAVKDSKVDAVRSPGGVALPTLAQDADNGTAGYASSGTGASGQAPATVRVAGKNSRGEPVLIEYAVSADGTKSYVTHYTQTDAGGQTVVKSQAVTVDAATGQVVSASGATNAGTINGVGTATPTVTTGATVTPSDIVFPSDYARAGEAANAANNIKASVDPIKDAVTPSVDLIDPVIPTWQDPWGTTFNAVKGWSLPSHSSTCPVGTFAWNNTNYSIDSHCTLVTTYWGALQGAMSVVWTILAFFIVLGA